MQAEHRGKQSQWVSQKITAVFQVTQNSSLEHNGTSRAQQKQSDSGCSLKADLTGYTDGWAAGQDWGQRTTQDGSEVLSSQQDGLFEMPKSAGGADIVVGGGQEMINFEYEFETFIRRPNRDAK